MTCALGLAGAAAATPAEAETVNQGNALAPYDYLSEVNNASAPKIVKTYSFAGSSASAHTIKTKAGNEKITLKTTLLLPTSVKGKHAWGHSQSSALVGKWLFVAQTLGGSKGFIARWDLDKLRAAGVKGGSKKIRELSGGGAKKVRAALKIGPVFQMAHGQSLSYDAVTDRLYMWQNGYQSNPKYKRIAAISTATLKPVTVYQFRVTGMHGDIPVGNNLAFDGQGHFYYDQVQANPSPGTSKGSVKFYRGTITPTGIQLELMDQVIKNRPGTLDQGLGYNQATGRLYLVSNGAVTSLPVAQLQAGTLQASDLRYSVFKTKREFEGLTFDQQGHGYLLCLGGPELLRSTTTW
jgi:hypothetical protein